MLCRSMMAITELTVFAGVLLSVSGLQIASAQQLYSAPIIKAVTIRGNTSIDTALIEQAVTRTKVNDPFVDHNISDDVKAIYNLGYFADVIAKWQLLEDGGLVIIFEVVENPKIEDIVFTGTGELPVQDFISGMQSKQGEILNFNLLLDDLAGFQAWAFEQHGVDLRLVNLNISETGTIMIDAALTKIAQIVLQGNEKGSCDSPRAYFCSR